MGVLDQLLQFARKIKFETEEEANTAELVGSTLEGIILYEMDSVNEYIRQPGVDTYALLLTTYPTPNIGWRVLVRADETYGGKATLRQWNGSLWVNLETPVYEDDIMLSGGTEKTGAQLDAEIAQLDTNIEKLDTEIVQTGIKLQYGTNRLNPNYADGFNKGLSTNGNVIANTGWYVTPPIRWDGEPSLLCQRYRLSCQYDASGKFIPGSYQNTASNGSELNITVSKASGAVYMRLMLHMTHKDISMIVTGTVMPSPYVPFKQIVSTDLNNGATVFEPNVSIDEKLQGWVFSESFKLTSVPTYTNGMLNSPIDVQYPDGGTGTVNFTRNSFGSLTTLGANHNEKKRRLTLIIGRDAKNNLVSQNIIFADIP